MGVAPSEHLGAELEAHSGFELPDLLMLVLRTILQTSCLCFCILFVLSCPLGFSMNFELCVGREHPPFMNPGNATARCTCTARVTVLVL